MHCTYSRRIPLIDFTIQRLHEAIEASFSGQHCREDILYNIPIGVSDRTKALLEYDSWTNSDRAVEKQIGGNSLNRRKSDEDIELG